MQGDDVVCLSVDVGDDLFIFLLVVEPAGLGLVCWGGYESGGDWFICFDDDAVEIDLSPDHQVFG